MASSPPPPPDVHPSQASSTSHPISQPRLATPGVVGRRVQQFQQSKFGQRATTLWHWRRSILFGFGISYAIINYSRAKSQARKRDRIHDKTYLYWKLYDGGIVEAKSTGSSLNYLLNSSQGGSPEEPPRVMTLFEVVRTLKFIEQDDRIHGIIADFSNLHVPSVPSYHLGLAQLEEIQDALLELRRVKQERLGPDGFRTVAWTDSFHSQGQYLFASMFDEVYTQPTGEVPLVGMGSTTPFFGKLAKWLGIDVHAEARNEYKSFVQPYIDEAFTQPQKDNQVELINDLNNNLLTYIARNRFPSSTTSESLERVKNLTKRGPFTATEAIENGLIDGTCYRQDVVDSVLDVEPALVTPSSPVAYQTERSQQPQSDRKLMGLYHYSKVMEKAVEKHIKDAMEIGVVYLMGTIGDAGEFGTAAVVKGLKEAGEDDTIGAVVLRIDSGGGGVIESDTIWGAIRDLREKHGKTVVASFGNASASGGYLVSTHADAIIAAPSTVTGSIGVAAIRPTLLQSFFDRLHITLDSYFTGSRSQDVTHKLTGADLERHRRHVDEMYEDFKGRVMDGRGIHQDLMDLVAGGRVMTGLKAFELTAPPELIQQIKGLEDDVKGVGSNATLNTLQQSPSESNATVAMSPDQETSPYAPPETNDSNLNDVASKNLPVSPVAPVTAADVLPDSAEQHAQQALATATDEELARPGSSSVQRKNKPGGTGVVQKKQKDVSAVFAADSTNVVDSAATAAPSLTESDQGEREQSDAGTGTLADAIAKPAGASSGVYEIKLGPFGRGLIDGIGGIRDAAVYACEIFISNGIAGFKQDHPEMSDIEAIRALMPESNWQLDENGALTMQMDVRLKRFPVQKSFWQQVQEASARGDSMDVEMLSNYVKASVAQWFLQLAAGTVANELEEFGVSARGGAGGSGLGLGGASRRSWMRAEWTGLNVR
ncbi:hypothetical protein OIV83_005004 [Microbotryomycetes sp. JL201]|nr:hypothetical protein OIV83_005004 [Microbotryomycetes sp. JL201]